MGLKKSGNEGEKMMSGRKKKRNLRSEEGA